MDTGAVIRAIKLGYPDEVIASTLEITTESANLIKKEFAEIKSMHSQKRPWVDAAAILMKEPEVIWYAYHVIETSDEELKQEILDENEGKPRLKPPHLPEPKDPEKEHAKEQKSKGGGGRGGKERKSPKKEEIDDSLEKEAEKATGELLMDDAGRIGRELAIKRQEIGKHVMGTMDATMRELGYKDPIPFLQMLFGFYLENNAKIVHISKLETTINTLTELLGERNRKAYISKQMDAHVLQLVKSGLPVKSENLLEYARFLELQITPVNIESPKEEEANATS